MPGLAAAGAGRPTFAATGRSAWLVTAGSATSASAGRSAPSSNAGTLFGGGRRTGAGSSDGDAPGALAPGLATEGRSAATAGRSSSKSCFWAGEGAGADAPALTTRGPGGVAGPGIPTIVGAPPRFCTTGPDEGRAGTRPRAGRPRGRGDRARPPRTTPARSAPFGAGGARAEPGRSRRPGDGDRRPRGLSGAGAGASAGRAIRGAAPGDAGAAAAGAGAVAPSFFTTKECPHFGHRILSPAAGTRRSSIWYGALQDSHSTFSIRAVPRVLGARALEVLRAEPLSSPPPAGPQASNPRGTTWDFGGFQAPRSRGRRQRGARARLRAEPGQDMVVARS